MTGPVVCPLAPAPPPPVQGPPAPAPPGAAPAPRVTAPLAYDLGASEIVVAGLLLRKQADDGYLVFDLAHRHVATLGPDGILEEAPAYSRFNHCDRRPVGGMSTTCELDVSFGPSPVAGNSPGAGEAALAVLWALAHGARQASRHPRVRGETPRPLDHTVRIQTATVRAQLARRYHVDAYCSALGELTRSLTRVHRARRGDPAGQRAALFRLWDGVEPRFASPGPGLPSAAVTEVKGLRQQALEHARALVEQFARTKHPASSPQAYEPSELDALNRTRRSPAPFDPYHPAR